MPPLLTLFLVGVEAWILLYSVTATVVFGVKGEDTSGYSCVWIGVFFCFFLVTWLGIMLWLRARDAKADVVSTPVDRSAKPSAAPRPVRVNDTGLPIILHHPDSVDVSYGEQVVLAVVAAMGNAAAAQAAQRSTAAVAAQRSAPAAGSTRPPTDGASRTVNLGAVLL